MPLEAQNDSGLVTEMALVLLARSKGVVTGMSIPTLMTKSKAWLLGLSVVVQVA